jgi:pimeloyl-ACP methyl ester carboxylesterase
MSRTSVATLPEEVTEKLIGWSDTSAGTGAATPTVVSAFARDILPAPRSYAEAFLNVHDFVKHPAGGHFAAWEQPEAYAADLDQAVRLGSALTDR